MHQGTIDDRNAWCWSVEHDVIGCMYRRIMRDVPELLIRLRMFFGHQCQRMIVQAQMFSGNMHQVVLINADVVMHKIACAQSEFVCTLFVGS